MAHIEEQPRRAHASPPVLLFDGDCAFCSSCARWLDQHLPGPATIAAWQLTDLAPLGVTAEQTAAAVVWVDVSLEASKGPEGFARMAQTSTSGGWRALGRFLGLRPVLAVTWPIYRLIAANRHRMPGGTPQCKLDLD